jgi:hypothetical protein
MPEERDALNGALAVGCWLSGVHLSCLSRLFRVKKDAHFL